MTCDRLMLAAAALLVTSISPVSVQTPRFSARVEAVRVDVLVTQHGRPVLGLTPEDFEIRDNGVRQEVSFVALEALPLDVMVTLDLSGSVDGQRLDDLRAASTALIDSLKPGDRAGLTTFNYAVTQPRRMTSEVSGLRGALDSAVPSGRTSLIDSIHLGVTAFESDGRHLLMVFSDGLDTASWLTEAQVLDSVKRSQVVLYAIAVGQRRFGPRFLRDVADASGGQLIDVERTGDLGDLFVGILDEFRQRYLLSYIPRGADAAGWHKLEVRVRRRGVDVRAREGYFRNE